MKSANLITMVLLFMSVLNLGDSQNYGSFTEQPQDYSAVKGTRHSFHCTFELSAVYQELLSEDLMYVWSVSTRAGQSFLTSVSGEKAELEEMGINVNENTLTVPANRETNGTSVQCKVQEFSNFSKHAYLLVLGPPTPPEPTLTAVNDTLKFSWAPAWSWDSHPVTHYTVTLTNTTDGSVYTNQTNETAWYFTHEEGADPKCNVLMVNVTATSDIGEGEAGQVVGGFPLSPAPFKLINCSECKVTFLSSLIPMYTISFKLPDICPYQTGRYHVLLYGPEVPAPIVEETEYTTANTIDPLTFNVDSTALAVNNTYTVVVFVSNSEGTTNASVTFDTELKIPPHLLQNPNTVITVTDNDVVLIAGIIIGVALLIIITVFVIVITIICRRRRSSGVAQQNLAKVILEDHHTPPHVGPNTQTETRIYETIDGFQKEKNPSPTYPPPVPPLRAKHHHTPDHLTVPQTTFDSEKYKDSNAYLQLLSETGKTDPEVRPTENGEYISMKSVSLRNAQSNNTAAMNRMALQTPKGFNEDNYMVFMEQGEK